MNMGEGQIEEGTEYEASSFGDFAAYFRNKQQKLQNRDSEERVRQTSDSTIFKGCVIHVNGYTEPSIHELHRLVVLNGGIFLQYMNNKSSATHIIASSLTPKKCVEFANYKVVSPSWIVESVYQRKLLPWESYKIIQQSGLQAVLESNATSGSIAPSRKSINGANSDFIKSYYESSRLHHLSSWKAELKQRLGHMMTAKRSAQGYHSNLKEAQKFILHVDFDCFFASVSCLKRPELAGQPVCVSHGGGSHSEIASCNYAARKFGVRNGMWMERAKLVCPQIVSLPYEFEDYKRISNLLYDELLKLNPDYLEPVSIDEALLDMSTLGSSFSPDETERKFIAFGENFRRHIFDVTRVSVSVGIGRNIMQAKIATKLAKPEGTFFVDDSSFREATESMSVTEIPGVGFSTCQKLRESLDVVTIRDLCMVSMERLQDNLGPHMGKKLWNNCRGIDDMQLGKTYVRKSVSAEINWGVRFEHTGQFEDFLSSLSTEVSERLSRLDVVGSRLGLKILRRAENAPVEPPKFMGCGVCDSFTKSTTSHTLFDEPQRIYRCSLELFTRMRIPVHEIRGVGIQITRLTSKNDSKIEKQDSLAKFQVVEVLQDKKIKNTAKHGSNDNLTSSFEENSKFNFNRLRTVQQRVWLIPTFQNLNRSTDLYCLLGDWYKYQIDGPHKKDANLFLNYLYEVVLVERNLDKAVRLVDRLSYITSKAVACEDSSSDTNWQKVIEDAKSLVSSSAALLNIFNLQFKDFCSSS
ncbi:uncharacterized protein V1510DRAFT_379483 [Dipodascopsis tothii]|uniref:uncharacterized protein n=1 Tax=Dipodascopsis tothii TaxID=44089 RepID=UPI0034CFB517